MNFAGSEDGTSRAAHPALEEAQGPPAPEVAETRPRMGARTGMDRLGCRYQLNGVQASLSYSRISGGARRTARQSQSVTAAPGSRRAAA